MEIRLSIAQDIVPPDGHEQALNRLKAAVAKALDSAGLTPDARVAHPETFPVLETVAAVLTIIMFVDWAAGKVPILLKALAGELQGGAQVHVSVEAKRSSGTTVTIDAKGAPDSACYELDSRLQRELHDK